MTKQRIIDTAMQLFWENGFESVGTDLICKAANVRKGSLYHFFPSKDVLALEVVNYRWQLFESQVLKLAFDKNTPPLKRFEKFSDILGNMACRIKNQSGDVYGCPFGNFASELSNTKMDIRGRIAEIFSEYTAYFEDALEDAVATGELEKDFNCKQMANLLFAGVQGTVLVAKAGNNPEILKENFRGLFGFLGN